MNDLTRKGVDRENAYRMMELVRKAHKTLTERDEEELRRLGMPAWYIESLRKIWYLFPKAHAVQYTILAVKLAWYKLHYPAEYYAAYFSAHPRLFWHWTEQTDEIGAYCSKEAVQDRMIGLRIAYEAMCRDVEFLPPDPERSHEKRFLPEDGDVRLPMFKSTE